MTTYTVASGQVFSSALGPSDVASVLSGGETSGVQDGGHEYVSSGGLSYSDTVLSGGVLALSSGAVGAGETILRAGVLSGPGALSGYSYDYGLVSGVQLDGSSGPAYLFVDSGGVASGVDFVGLEANG